MPPRLAGAAVQAHLAAVLFAVGAILLAVGRGIENGHGGVGLDPGTYSQRSTGFTNDRSFLDYSFEDQRVHDRWNARARAAAPMLLGHFAAGLGWLFSLPAVTSLSHVLGGGERSATSTMVYAFVAAGILTIVEFTSEAGTAQTSAWMTSTWSLLKDRSRSDAGELTAAQAFEMSHMLTVSRTLWLYAADDLLLALALGTASWLQVTSKVATSNGHALLGLMTVFLCFFDFGFEINRFQAWRWSNNACIVTTLLIDVVLLPAWLVWLGVLLRRVDALGGTFSTVGNTQFERGDDPRARSRIEPAASGPDPSEAGPSDIEMAPAAAPGAEEGAGP